MLSEKTNAPVANFRLPTNWVITDVKPDPATGLIYAAAQGLLPDQTTLINGKNYPEVATVKAGSGLSFDVTTDAEHNSFFSSEEMRTVIMYDGKANTLVAAANTGGEMAGISADPAVDKIYAADWQNNVLDVLSETIHTVIRAIPLGTNPEYMDIDPLRGFLYVGI